jgi:hypothetical protein
MVVWGEVPWSGSMKQGLGTIGRWDAGEAFGTAFEV